MYKCFRSIHIILLIALLLACAGCAGAPLKNWATILPDNEAKKSFDDFQINPAYNYFYSGCDTYARSILAIDKAYKLDSGLWVKIEFTKETLREMVSNMRARALWCQQPLFGYAIRDGAGKQIGVWYSIMVSGMNVKMRENGQVNAYPPNDDEYKGYEDRHDHN